MDPLKVVFATIPIGILIVNKDGTIESTYSTYSEWLLATDKIAGRHLNDVLFVACLPRMTDQERAVVIQLFDSLGRSEMEFEKVKDRLPRYLHFISESNMGLERYLGMTYQPVIFNHKVEKLFLIIEDRTELVKTRQAEEKTKNEEEMALSRFLQIKSCSPDMLPLISEEISGLFEKLKNLFNEQDAAGIMNTLHSIKGNSRVAGFNFLTRLTHESETLLAEAAVQVKSAPGSYWERVTERLKIVEGEWLELKAIYHGLVQKEKPVIQSIPEIQKLFEKYHNLLAAGTPTSSYLAERINWALHSFHFVDLTSFEEFLKLRVEQTAVQLKKEVQVEFHWNDISVDQHMKSAISDALLHLLVNAVYHGIEMPEERVRKGKTRAGRISVRAWESSGICRCEVEDDGAGLDVEKIKSVALKKGVITLGESLTMTHDEVIQLIFTPGFSTAEQVDEIAGRGIGLEAVLNTITQLGGSVSARTGEFCGSRFTVGLQSWKILPLKKSCSPLREFFGALEQQIREIGITRNFKFEAIEGFQGDENRRGLLYGDQVRLILSVSNYFGYFGNNGSLLVKFKKEQGGVLSFRGERLIGAGSWKGDMEFQLALGASNNYLKKHQGEVVVRGDIIDIRFGTIIDTNKIPAIQLCLGSGVTKLEAQTTITTVLEVAQDLCVPIKHFEKREKDVHSLTISRSLIEGANEIPLRASSKYIQTVLIRLVEKVLGIPI